MVVTSTRKIQMNLQTRVSRAIVNMTYLITVNDNLKKGIPQKKVAQWTTIAHHEASIMFGDTIINDAQRQVTLNLKQLPEIN